MTDYELLQGASDEELFRKLYERYKDKVYNTALYQLSQPEDAEEITQDVFTEIFRSSGGFKGDSHVSTWIYRITINKCLDKHRSHQRKKRSLISYLFGDIHESMEPVEYQHPGMAAEQRETYQQLFAAIHRLSGNQKTAFILTYVEDLPQREVAEILGLKLKAVESLLQRAKQALRKDLGGSELRRENNNTTSK